MKDRQKVEWVNIGVYQISKNLINRVKSIRVLIKKMKIKMDFKINLVITIIILLLNLWRMSNKINQIQVSLIKHNRTLDSNNNLNNISYLPFQKTKKQKEMFQIGYYNNLHLLDSLRNNHNSRCISQDNQLMTSTSVIS